MTFSNKGGRVRRTMHGAGPPSQRPVEEVVRELKKNQDAPPGEDYREKSLRIHGLVCAKCGRTFDGAHRHLLTVHHRDGNHHNNPPDGSNWENLCVYCHEDAHSRELLGEYLAGVAGRREDAVVYRDEMGEQTAGAGFGSLGEKLRKVLSERGGSS